MGVRLDSGDLLAQSRRVREILDAAGCRHARIVASGDLNEFSIAELLARGAPIDMFGVGTDLVTSRDAPALSVVYKLVALEEPDGGRVVRVKYSPDKATLGGAKQVFRKREASGMMAGDTVGLAEEVLPGEPLLVQVMRGGELVYDLPEVRAIAARTAEQLASLPPHLRVLRGRAEYPVRISEALRQAQPAGIAPSSG